MAVTFIPSYMESAFAESLEPLVRKTKAALDGVDYDTLVGTGLSGALVVPTLGRCLYKHWLIVRKPNDGSHDHRKVAGTLGRRYVFIDDFIESGDTFYSVRRVLSSLRESVCTCPQCSITTVCVGSYEYENDFWQECRSTL